jgi:3-deoxy-D-manno-octulosonic-acid transferase
VLGLALKRLRAIVPGILLVLAPRHVERAEEIERELSVLGLRVVRRTALPEQRAECDVLLVDTTGELRHWYELADLVFVGKSLPGVREVGGQNPAEPGALGKAVVFGPHMENFEAVVTGLLREGAAVQVESAEHLTLELLRLAAAGEERERMGEKARGVLEPHQGATVRTAQVLASLWGVP